MILCMSMLDIRCRCNRLKALSLLSPIVLRYGVFNRVTPNAALSTSVDPMGEAPPKINSWRIFGKKSVSPKFKASIIIPSGGSSKVKQKNCKKFLHDFYLSGDILAEKLYHQGME